MNEQEKRREEVALALMLKDGHQPEDIGDWRESVYAKKADEFIKQHSGDGLCPKCQGTGFTEQQHGLFRAFCDCEKGKALEAEVTGEEREVPPPEITRGADCEYEWEAKLEVANDSRSEDNSGLGGSDGSPTGTGQPDKPTGGANTSKPKQPRKPKSKKATRKGSR